MPEYSQIQTYLKCTQSNFNDVIKDFSLTLNSLGLDANQFKTELEWGFLDESNNYNGYDDYAQPFDSNGHKFHIRPHIMWWTPDQISELQESWLEVSLLFWTEEIVIDSWRMHLKDNCTSLVWAMMEQFSEQFKESGVYFTNESTDGKPWEALVCGLQENKWAFDAAILPTHLFHMYKERPTGMLLKMNENMMYLARKSIWASEPWMDKDST